MGVSNGFGRTIIAWILTALCVYPRPASATDSLSTGRAAIIADSLEWIPHVFANSEDEIYLRYLQIAGVVPEYPWSVRAFSIRETRKLSARVGSHPWSRTGEFTSRVGRTRLLPMIGALRVNSSFPYGSNDGPVWAGRGLTASATLGVALQAGPVSLTLAPTAFVAQNAPFELYDEERTGDLRFADGLFPTTVDRPQRFGDKPYGRIDPGNSTLRADIGPAAFGVSTANMAWGPLELYPFVLGTNAAGFPHGFLGTAHPVNIWIGLLHGRVIWGRLDQSEYSPVNGDRFYVSPSEPGTVRFASGMSILLQPRGLRGMELGVARFFHSPWPRSGIPPSFFTKPLENLLKSRVNRTPGFSDLGTGGENQLISGFVRWAFPAAGFEMYAEYGREDHSWDKRDFVQEPDHSRSYGLGFRKTMVSRTDRIDGLTVELVNFQLPHLARTGRGEGGLYTHGVMRQGHTHRGQLLGSGIGVEAASGSTMRWDSYALRGRTTIALHRVVRQEAGTFHLDGTSSPLSSEVEYAVEAMRTRRSRRIEMTTGITLIHSFNRNLRKNATGLSLVIAAQVPLKR